MKIDMLEQSRLLTQSMLGVISPNFRRIMIDLSREIIVVSIILEKKEYEDIEEINDSMSNFEAMQEFEIEYEFIITIDEGELTWPDGTTIVVYQRRE